MSPEVHLDVVPLVDHAALCTGSSNCHIDVILITECVNGQRFRCHRLMKDKICGRIQHYLNFTRTSESKPKQMNGFLERSTLCYRYCGWTWDKSSWLRHFSPVEMHSFCRPFMSLRRLSFMSSGPVHKTSDTVALVLFSHVKSHLARQSHSKALPRKSLHKRTTVCHCRKTNMWL